MTHIQGLSKNIQHYVNLKYIVVNNMLSKVLNQKPRLRPELMLLKHRLPSNQATHKRKVN